MWLHNDTGIDVTWNDTYQLIQFTNSTNLIGFDFVDNSKLKNNFLIKNKVEPIMPAAII